MLNEQLLFSSFDRLKYLLLEELTIFHIAIIYVLMYVVYKALGRYLYFKPQEHASKVNRTFLTVSLLIVLLHAFHEVVDYLPFLPEYRWFYALCGLVVFLAPLSIIMDRLIWEYNEHGVKSSRKWHYKYLPITKDYYKTSISKSERTNNFSTYSWEEEGVESTEANIHSDALLNLLALSIFIAVNGKWTYDSATNYGHSAYIFSLVVCLTITGLFLDRAIFSWINYLSGKRK